MRPIFRVHTDAVIAALESAGLDVGDAVAPADGPALLKGGTGYVVVYPVAGGASYGTLADHAEDAEIIMQVTCVGATREQAAWLADACNVLLDGLEVEDRSVPLVTLEVTPGVNRDDNQTPPVFYATPRYRIFSTPGVTAS